MRNVRRGQGLLPQALKTAETPSTAFEDLVKVDSKIVSDTRSNVAERTDPSVGVKIEYDETEEGESSAFLASELYAIVFEAFC